MVSLRPRQATACWQLCWGRRCREGAGAGDKDMRQQGNIFASASCHNPKCEIESSSVKKRVKLSFIKRNGWWRGVLKYLGWARTLEACCAPSFAASTSDSSIERDGPTAETSSFWRAARRLAWRDRLASFPRASCQDPPWSVQAAHGAPWQHAPAWLNHRLVLIQGCSSCSMCCSSVKVRSHQLRSDFHVQY